MDRRTVLVSLSASALSAVGCAPVSAPASADGAADAETRYLAFQVFTDSPSPHNGAGGQTLPNGPPARAVLDAFAADIIARIASAGEGRRRLALVFGPILFDHSDEQAVQLISDVFDIAIARNVAVGFHLDDSMFWRGRRDLVEDPRNVERADWSGRPSTERRLDWGPVPARLAPQMCLNSPAIEAEVLRRGRAVIGAAIARGLARLQGAGRDDLFAGVIVGWETHIGRDHADPQAPLGFCALSNLGLRPARPSKRWIRRASRPSSVSSRYGRRPWRMRAYHRRASTATSPLRRGATLMSAKRARRTRNSATSRSVRRRSALRTGLVSPPTRRQN